MRIDPPTGTKIPKGSSVKVILSKGLSKYAINTNWTWTSQSNTFYQIKNDDFNISTSNCYYDMGKISFDMNFQIGHKYQGKMYKLTNCSISLDEDFTKDFPLEIKIDNDGYLTPNSSTPLPITINLNQIGGSVDSTVYMRLVFLMNNSSTTTVVIKYNFERTSST